MRITVLGCGGAGGVPMVSHGWSKCDPANPKNRRLRSSILIEINGIRIIIDTGPDLRSQLLNTQIRHLDAVLYTHAHADHTHGIDELREINRAMKAPLDVFADQATLESIKQRFGYVFQEVDLEAGRSIYHPWLRPHVFMDDEDIESDFEIKGIPVKAFAQDHGHGRSIGFRFGDFAYCTDVWSFSDEAKACLFDLKVIMVGCLTPKPHPTHADLDKVIGWHSELKPRTTILTHMGPGLDYQALSNSLPKGIIPAYDGMSFKC